MKALKKNTLLALILIIAAVAVFGYIKIKTIQQDLEEGRSNTQKARQFDTYDEILRKEVDRCREFVSQGEGDFSEFEFCNKFLDWSKEFDLPN
jgi:hypothetical protein